MCQSRCNRRRSRPQWRPCDGQHPAPQRAVWRASAPHRSPANRAINRSRPVFPYLLLRKSECDWIKKHIRVHPWYWVKLGSDEIRRTRQPVKTRIYYAKMRMRLNQKTYPSTTWYLVLLGSDEIRRTGQEVKTRIYYCGNRNATKSTYPSATWKLVKLGSDEMRRIRFFLHIFRNKQTFKNIKRVNKDNFNRDLEHAGRGSAISDPKKSKTKGYIKKEKIHSFNSFIQRQSITSLSACTHKATVLSGCPVRKKRLKILKKTCFTKVSYNYFFHLYTSEPLSF